MSSAVDRRDQFGEWKRIGGSWVWEPNPAPAPPEPVMVLSAPQRFPAPHAVTMRHAAVDSLSAPLESVWTLWTHVPPILATALISPLLAYASACMYDRNHSEHIRDLWTLPTRAWEHAWETARHRVWGWLNG